MLFHRGTTYSQVTFSKVKRLPTEEFPVSVLFSLLLMLGASEVPPTFSERLAINWKTRSHRGKQPLATIKFTRWAGEEDMEAEGRVSTSDMASVALRNNLLNTHKTGNQMQYKSKKVNSIK